MRLPMPKIVSNTTPLISLLKIDQLALLQKIYRNIIIPSAVFAEVEQGKTKPYYTDLSKLDWISIQEIREQKAMSYFYDLDAGEAAVIILATELKADLVIIDEILGRRFAKHAGHQVTGTLGILMKAKELGLIDKVGPLLDEMQQKGIWMSKQLKEKILKRAKE